MIMDFWILSWTLTGHIEVYSTVSLISLLLYLILSMRGTGPASRYIETCMLFMSSFE